MRSLAVMRALVMAEWRDARVVVWGALILSLIVGAAFHTVMSVRFSELGLACWLAAPMAAAFAIVLAAEVVGGGTSGRRFETLVMLPARISTLFMAKVAFLLIATSGFFVWAIVTQGLIAGALGASEVAARSVLDLRHAIPVIVGGIALTGIALAFATAVSRPLPVVLLTVIVGIAGYLVVKQAPWKRWDLVPMQSEFVTAMARVGLLFFVAAGIAFVLAPAHRSGVGRRATIAIAIPFGLLAVFSGITAERLERSFRFAPGDGPFLIVNVQPSPNGRWIAVGVRRGRSNFTHCSWTWIVDRDSNSTRGLDRHHIAPLWWDAEDRLRAGWYSESIPDGSGRTNRFYISSLVDPATGSVLDGDDETTLITDDLARHVGNHEPNLLDIGRSIATAPWLKLTRTENREFVAIDARSGRRTVIWPSEPRALRAFLVGANRAIVTGSDWTRLVDVSTGEVVAATFGGQRLTAGLPSATKTNERFLAHEPNSSRWFVVDASRGDVIAGPFDFAFPRWVIGGDDARFITTGWRGYDSDESVLIDIETNTVTALERDMVGAIRIGPERLICWWRDHLDEIDAQGRLVRRLLSSPKEDA